jgi:hypothetical protein
MSKAAANDAETASIRDTDVVMEGTVEKAASRR